MARVKQLNVNGKEYEIDVDGERTLLSVLRDDLDLTGTKYGCGEGQCGACTVLIDGTPIHSCRARMTTILRRKITTIEGLETNRRLHPLQQAFLDAGAMQCGYCTSGMIMAGVGLLRKNANPTNEEILVAMKGNICRCGTYQRILSAIREGAKALQGGGTQ
jgi:aerobic-type carbon monoxide dehydrogenase small subunit (CoxS/CutS family)